MPPSDLSPRPLQDSDPISNADQEKQGGVTHKSEDEVSVAFGDWGAVTEIEGLYDRVLLSVVAVAYAQQNSSDDLKSYIASLKPEVRQAFSSRANDIVGDYNAGLIADLKKERLAASWAEAAQFGIKNYLEDFANAQVQSFRDLDLFVRERTNLKTQAIVAFCVALSLAVFVGAVSHAITVWDDWKAAIISTKKEP